LTTTIHNKPFRLLIDNAAIQKRVAEIAAELTENFKDKNPVVLVVLRGAFMFAADILKHFNIPCEIDFVQLSSYAGLYSSGEITLKSEPETNLKNKDIIIIEDIVDSGLTMSFFIVYLKNKAVKSITLVSLLVKPENIKTEITVDYAGFAISNLFVAGYGLDYNENGRNLDAIYQEMN
jgi:hypoxanthine phosphoribosyltransferase